MIIDPAVVRRLRRGLGGGAPLEADTRTWMEGSFGIGLARVRIHTDWEADRLAGHFTAEAFTVGADIFFRSGRFNPSCRRGRQLLAHEVAHAMQQSAAETTACPGQHQVLPNHSPSEYAADRAADFALCGKKVPGPWAPPRPLAPSAALVVQCHSSWEHRMLGECNTNSLDQVTKALAKNSGASGAYLNKLRQFALLWKTAPEMVTEGKVKEHFPDIRTLRLNKSGLLVTYGELNTLADYLPQPAVLDEQPHSILLPILQTVRQKMHNKIGMIFLGTLGENFAGALVDYRWCGFADKILETTRMNNLTKSVGRNGVGRYYGLLARNACHFAPYAWHRWYQFHMIARQYAEESKKTNEGGRGENLYKAWLYHGYADHFLQDSFAAGHLINKTRIMQWFVEWVDKVKSIDIGQDLWPKAKNMTTKMQPNLAPPAMYTDWPYVGTIKDPETAQEYATREARRSASGVSTDKDYFDYLAFLTSGVIQASAATVHDYFNEKSLWVSSATDTTPYRIWGDDTMMVGGDGVRIASETAQMSQQAIINILSSGNDGGITPKVIHNRIPTRVGSGPDCTLSLEDWHDEVLFDECWTRLFARATNTYRAVRATNHKLGKVSLDDHY